MKNPNGTYSSEAERKQMIDRANQMYAQSKAAKEGAYGADRNAKIEALRNQIDALENGSVKSAKEATQNMARAKSLRDQLDSLLSTGFNVLEAQDFNSREAEARAAQFSNIQAGLLGAEAERALAIDAAWERVVYNPTIGVSRSTLDRQLGKLLAGEGETDQHGRYVRFQDGKSSMVYRAYVNEAGDYGFVAESKGSDAAYNGLGDSAE